MAADTEVKPGTAKLKQLGTRRLIERVSEVVHQSTKVQLAAHLTCLRIVTWVLVFEGLPI
jgi:hypothetical protein